MIIMEKSMFVLSLFLTMCVVGMLYGAIVNESPMRSFYICVVLGMCALSGILIRISYRELRRES